MPSYHILMTGVIEWDGVVDAPDAKRAEFEARLMLARSALIVDTTTLFSHTTNLCDEHHSDETTS